MWKDFETLNTKLFFKIPQTLRISIPIDFALNSFPATKEVKYMLISNLLTDFVTYNELFRKEASKPKSKIKICYFWQLHNFSKG